jgi:hypothetical protein
MFGAVAAVARTGKDQLTLKLGKPAQNAVRRRNSATRCGFLTEVAKLLRRLDDGDVLLGSATRFFKS